jgi:hypothetical protein
LASELLFDRLVEIGPSLNTIGDTDFQPRLAKSWAWSEDSLRIIFTLHEDATWHDGRPVIAADVQAGYRAIMDSANGSNLLADLADVAGVVANADGTVTIQFKRRAPEQFYAASVIFPLPAHLMPTEPGATLATSELARNPVGSGPYRFVKWEPLERFEFEAVEDFYRGRARLDRVVVPITPAPATGLARLWAEEADVWELLPAGDVAEATASAFGINALGTTDPVVTSQISAALPAVYPTVAYVLTAFTVNSVSITDLSRFDLRLAHGAKNDDEAACYLHGKPHPTTVLHPGAGGQIAMELSFETGDLGATIALGNIVATFSPLNPGDIGTSGTNKVLTMVPGMLIEAGPTDGTPSRRSYRALLKHDGTNRPLTVS